MKKRPVVMWLLRLALPTLALSAIIVGCSGGGGGGDQNVAPAESVLTLSRGVRVAIRFSQPAPNGYLQYLDPNVRQAREAEGVVFEPTRVVFPEMPATGYYLRIGDHYFSGGPNGEFYIPNDVTVPADVPLFKQLTDANPLGTVQIGDALQPGTARLRTVYFTTSGRVLGSAALMDGGPTRRNGRSSVVRALVDDACRDVSKTSRVVDDGCNRYECDVRSNEIATGCCLDHDPAKGRIRGGGGPGEEGEENIGEGAEGNEEGEGGGDLDDCGQKRVAEFYGTECYKWTIGSGAHSAECWNETAIWGNYGVAGCWDNHKYRYCQNMDSNDFSVQTFTSTTVQVGSTVSIGVRNNTPKYDTSVDLSSGALGTIVTTDFATGGTIKHYDDANKLYVATRLITYRAPEELPNGQTEAYERITFSANGLTQTITLRIVQKCRDSRGREVPCP